VSVFGEGNSPGPEAAETMAVFLLKCLIRLGIGYSQQTVASWMVKRAGGVKFLKVVLRRFEYRCVSAPGIKESHGLETHSFFYYCT
jgi:hypothetical protein